MKILIMLWKEKKNDNDEYVYSLRSKDNKYTCVAIFIIPSKKLAHIDSLSNYNSCVKSGPKIGSKVLLLTIKFLIENKKHLL